MIEIYREEITVYEVYSNSKYGFSIKYPWYDEDYQRGRSDKEKLGVAQSYINIGLFEASIECTKPIV